MRTMRYRAMRRRQQTRRRILSWLFLLISVIGLSDAASSVETAGTERTIILRADSPERRINSQDIRLSIEGRSANVVSVMDAADAYLSIALVIDTGPNQAAVLDREKQLASSLIAQFNSGTDFIVISARRQTTKIVDTTDGQVAIDSVHALTNETGKKSLIPLYRAVAMAIDELSVHPGIRALVVIAEGNDFGSGIRYKQLRASAQAQHISVSTALVAAHSTRGSKAILSFGWDLQSLAWDTAGVFVENDRKTHRVVDRLTRTVRSLRLIKFGIEDLPPGRYRVSISASSVGRLHAQKAIVIGGAVDRLIVRPGATGCVEIPRHQTQA